MMMMIIMIGNECGEWWVLTEDGEDRRLHLAEHSGSALV
jgi:hypothetical protein